MADKNLARERILEGYDPETGEVDAVEWLKSAYMGLMAPRQKEAYLEGRDPSLADYVGDALFASLNFTPMGPVGTKALGFFASKTPKIAKALSKAPKGIKAIADAALAPAAENAYDFANYDDGRGSIENVGANMSLETALNILTPKIISKVRGRDVFDMPEFKNKYLVEEAEERVREAFREYVEGNTDAFDRDIVKKLNILTVDDLKKTGFFDKALYGIEKTNGDMPWTKAYKKGAAINNPSSELVEKDILKDFGVDDTYIPDVMVPVKDRNLVTIKEEDPLMKEMLSDAYYRADEEGLDYYTIDEAKNLFSRNRTPEEMEDITSKAIADAQSGESGFIVNGGLLPDRGDASTLSEYSTSAFDVVLDKLARDPDIARIMYVPYDYNAKDAAKYGIFSGLNKKFNDYLVEDYLEEDEDIDE